VFSGQFFQLLFQGVYLGLILAADKTDKSHKEIDNVLIGKIVAVRRQNRHLGEFDDIRTLHTLNIDRIRVF